MLSKWVPPLAWVWMIIVGGLLITPEGTWCIRCGGGLHAPGFIGDPLTVAIGIVSIVLGIAGFVSRAASGPAARQ